MKQSIKIGALVDDGSGDFLRKGGQKINNNFDEIYHNLGDTQNIHESGAWKTITESIEVDFGRSLAINTSNNTVNITLPKGKQSDYNKTIKLRDVWKSWSKSPVTLFAAPGDTIKGLSTAVLDRELMDVELVYTSPGRWEYIPNKRVDLISNSNLSTVSSKSFIATAGQTTFASIFGNDLYNTSSIEVYYRGNLLYYGDKFSSKSEYGSLDNGVLSELDGKNITLAFPCDEGDTVIVVTYMDGIASYRTSYISKTVIIRDEDKTEQEGSSILARNLDEFDEITIQDFDLSVYEKVNPAACEIFVNGVLLTNEASAETPSGFCSIDGIYNEETCLSLNGDWTISYMDYELVTDNNSVSSIKFARRFRDQDVVTLKCFNNDIGTLLDWDGDDGIKERSEELFLISDQELTRNLVEYIDYDNPSQDTLQKIAEPVISKVNNIGDMFDVFHPIGTVYENAHNPENPASYMGMGLWKRYMEGRVTVSWSSDSSDTHFGLNNNNLFNDLPTHTSGGTGGGRSFTIVENNIPTLESESYVLVKDSNGEVIIGACEFDPEDKGPDLRKYAEKILKSNDSVQTPVEISILQPYVTVHRWIRVG